MYSSSRENPDPLRSVGLSIWWLVNPCGGSTVPRRARKMVPSWSRRGNSILSIAGDNALYPSGSSWSESPEEPGQTEGMKRCSSTPSGYVWGQALASSTHRMTPMALSLLILLYFSSALTTTWHYKCSCSLSAFLLRMWTSLRAGLSSRSPLHAQSLPQCLTRSKCSINPFLTEWK